MGLLDRSSPDWWRTWMAQPSTSDVAVGPPPVAWTVPGNGVGLLGKFLGGLGLDASGARGAQSWGNAGRQSLYDLAHLPDTMLESTAQAVTAPTRAYRGEIPDDQMLPEGLNVAGAMAVGSAGIPRPKMSPFVPRDEAIAQAVMREHPIVNPWDMPVGTSDYFMPPTLGKASNVPRPFASERPPMVMDTNNGLAQLFENSQQWAKDGLDGLGGGYTLRNMGLEAAHIPNNDIVSAPMSAYERGALAQEWRRKIARTGELFANSENSAVPGTLLSSASHLDMSPEARQLRGYHGTTHEIVGPMRTNPGARGEAVYLSTDPSAASSYTGVWGDPGNYARFSKEGDHPSVLPVDVTGRVFDENAMVSSADRKAMAKAYNSDLRKRHAESGRKTHKDELVSPTEFGGSYFDRAYQPRGYNVLQSLSYDPDHQNRILAALGYKGRMGGAAGMSGGQDIAMFGRDSIKSATTGETLFANSENSALAGLPMMQAAKRADAGSLSGTVMDTAARYNPYRGFGSGAAVPASAAWGAYLYSDGDPDITRSVGRATAKTATYGLGGDLYDSIFGKPTVGEYVDHKFGMEHPALTNAAKVRAALRYGEPENIAQRKDREALPMSLERLHEWRNAMRGILP